MPITHWARDVSFRAEAVNASYRTGARVGLNMS